MTEDGKQTIQAGGDAAVAAEVRELKKRICELVRVLDKKNTENEILRGAVKLAHQKKLISRLRSPPEDNTLSKPLPLGWAYPVRSCRGECEKQCQCGLDAMPRPTTLRCSRPFG